MLNYYQKLQQAFSESDLKLFWIENAKPDLGIFSANLGSVIQSQKASGGSLNDDFWNALKLQIENILTAQNLPFSVFLEKGFVNLKLKSEVVFESFFRPILDFENTLEVSTQKNNNSNSTDLKKNDSKNADPSYTSYIQKTILEIPKNKDMMLLEYVSTNVAKPMHAGHLVNSVYGESLRRIFSLFYADIVTDCHWGDWGVNFGVTLWAWKEIAKKQAAGETVQSTVAGKLETIDLNKYQQNPIDTLVKVYVWGNQMKGQMLDENGVDRWDDLVRSEFKKLEDGNKENLTLWKGFVNDSKIDVKEVLQDLGVPEFDLEQGESYYEPTMRVLKDWLDKEQIWEVEGTGRYFDFEKIAETWQAQESSQSNKNAISDTIPNTHNLDSKTDPKVDFSKVASLGRAYMIQSKDGYTTYCFRDVAARLNWVIEHGSKIMVTITDHTQRHNFEQAYTIVCFLKNQKGFGELVENLKQIYTHS